MKETKFDRSELRFSRITFGAVSHPTQGLTAAPILHMDVARARRSRRVLFVGNPARYVEVSYWAMVKQWMVVHGLEPVRNPDGDVLCVVVTEDVLDGVCSTQDAETIERLRGRGVPVIDVHDTTQIWQATSRVRARLAESAVGDSRARIAPA